MNNNNSSCIHKTSSIALLFLKYVIMIIMMISLLGIAFARGSQMLFRGNFYFSFGGSKIILSNLVKIAFLHCMLFVSLTVSFDFT